MCLVGQQTESGCRKIIHVHEMPEDENVGWVIKSRTCVGAEVT